MTKKERLGKFVLLEEVDSSGLGTEYRAAKLAGGGALERIVHLIRIAPKLCANPEFVKSLLEHAKSASLLHGPGFARLLAIGRVEAAYYMAYEYVAGRSLRAILERSRYDGFPFAPDHALLIASKICAALEAAGPRKDHGPAAHGLLTPNAIVVTFDGDVKLRGFASWPAGIHKAGGVSAAESAYLAPEQLKTGVAGARCDAFSIGVLLFEMLTGGPFRAAEGEDTARRLRGARMPGAGEDEQLAKPIAELVARTATSDPAARFSDMGALRKAIDALLFSGGFNPTTFNLAFFMNSLFRSEIEREAGLVAEEASASYGESAEAPPAAAPVAPAPKQAPPTPPAAPAPPPVPLPLKPAEPNPEIPIVPREEPRPPAPVRPRETPAAAPASVPPASVPVPHRDTAPPLTLRQEPQRGAPVMAVVGGMLALLAGGAGWYFLAGPGARRPAPPPPSTMSAEAAAALARVRELEEKLKKFEQEKAEAETKAVDDAKKKVEAQAAAKGQTVDPAALQRAQEDARRRTQLEQERRQQEQRQRLEAEKLAEETRLAEERRRAEAAAAAAAAAAATPVPTTVATAPPTTAPAPTPPPTTAAPVAAPTEPPAKPGALVNLADANVLPPVGIKQERPAYPPIAFQQRAEGRIELQALIDDKGNVADVKLVKGTTGIGLNQAALDGVRRWHYRPATKDGVPVKVWLPIIIEFRAPPK